MALKELAEHIPDLGERIEALIAGRRTNQVALAKAAGISRQTLSRILSTDRATRGAVERLAHALGVTARVLAPELFDEGKATESRTYAPALRFGEEPRVMRNHAIRVWLAEFRMELTKAQATDEEIEAAIALVTSPDVFTFYSGGKPRDFTEDQVMEGMEALAKVIRARLKQLGRKIR